MTPLAKLWTFIGNWFIPLAIVWTVYVRNGLGDKVALGVRVSRAYWGLNVTLLTACVMVWVFALYTTRAKRNRARTIIPPNTTFEDKDDRNYVISVGTLIVYIIGIAAAMGIFATSYMESVVHAWDEHDGLAMGFWDSRLIAFGKACSRTACFAMGSRYVDNTGNAISGVNQYFPYFSDELLMALIIVFLAGACRLGYLLVGIWFGDRPLDSQEV